jgi:hypothetical protein
VLFDELSRGNAALLKSLTLLEREQQARAQAEAGRQRAETDLRAVKEACTSSRASPPPSGSAS